MALTFIAEEAILRGEEVPCGAVESRDAATPMCKPDYVVGVDGEGGDVFDHGVFKIAIADPLGAIVLIESVF